ncbi:DUF2254 domain-containing protein [Streptomyces boluensis]|uniref:DUF2254 domain-containing protein n=1 Tax=Streptomyces boluensis TaxID=1775135 RepID=A0A964XQJ8_9ACTN|nr:DUF2254 domain-containing protein [Streptomyces boluensis]NBE55897.1 DUF2254 domain-containing protein [Streptomyces boluensis]
MNTQARSRPPNPSGGSQRGRRVRSQGVALILVGAGAILGWLVPRWERHLPVSGLSFDASTAQATLAAIAGSMITLAGFVVTAITLVVQTVQSMSPRLVSALGHFSRYLVLFGLLIGTALYALVALSHVRGDDVPRLTVTFAIGLVLCDAVAVLYLLGSLRHAVTGGGLARAVGDRLRTVIEQTTPLPDSPSPPPADPGPPSRTGREAVVLARQGEPSVLLALDERRLTQLAARHDVHIQLLRAVGDFVGTGEAVASVEPAGSSHPLDARTVRRFAACVRYGPSRTVEQDAAYGLRLLVDIAIRALSPAINDPTTAVQALDQIEDALLRLAARPLGPVRLADDTGRPRVLCPAPHWDDLVSLALDESVQYGALNPQVVRRLRMLLDRVLAVTPAERRAVVEERRAALDRLAAATLTDPLLSRVASVPDRQGLGGSYVRGAGEM